MAIIEVQDLTREFRVFQRREGVLGAVADLFQRRYETLRAVDAISFRIEKGERVGYIGPNGAGKSTTIKMLTGILFPTRGMVRVAGLDPHRQHEKCVRRIGAVFGQRSQLWWDLAPVEAYRLLGSIYGLGEEALKKRLSDFEAPLGIGEFLRLPVRKLSLGQKMRCELAAALLHSPDVVFLDEPTIGLDLMAKEGIRRFLLEENQKRGTTFILTTHDLSDIEELCERVIILDRGKILHDGGLKELKARLGGSGSLLFHFSAKGDGRWQAKEETDHRLEELKALTAARQVTWSVEEEGAFRATFDPQDMPRAELIRQILERFDVADVAMAEVKIEDVIRRIYGSLDGALA